MAVARCAVCNEAMPLGPSYLVDVEEFFYHGMRMAPVIELVCDQHGEPPTNDAAAARAWIREQWKARYGSR